MIYQCSDTITLATKPLLRNRAGNCPFMRLPVGRDEDEWPHAKVG